MTSMSSGRFDSTPPLIDRTLVDRVRHRLVVDEQVPTPVTVARALLTEGRVLGDVGVRAVVDALHAELVGLGPLQPLVGRPDVTDVLVVGHDHVYLDSGHGLQQIALRFAHDDEVTALAQRLAARCARRLDEAHPFADGQLSGGVRLHAVLPPVSERPCLSLRIARSQAFTLDDLVRLHTCDETGAQLLQRMVERRLAFLISGGTGSGKTTLLSTLLGLVPPHERLVVVEDTTELTPSHRHVVRLQSRPANIEGSGEITMRSLVRQALRMRPDRLVVGEVRGAEVVDLFAALNTGHEGGCGTVHANTARDVPARVEALGMTGRLDRHAVHSQLSAAIDAVVHVARDHSGQRRLSSVGVLDRGADGLVSVIDAWHAVDRHDHGPWRYGGGPGLALLRDRLGLS